MVKKFSGPNEMLVCVLYILKETELFHPITHLSLDLLDTNFSTFVRKSWKERYSYYFSFSLSLNHRPKEKENMYFIVKLVTLTNVIRNNIICHKTSLKISNKVSV